MKNILLSKSAFVLSLTALLGWTPLAYAQHHPGHVEVHREPYVGSVHYGERPIGGYRTIYRDDYFRRFRPGYFPIVIGGGQYYYYPSLPPGCGLVVIGGATYYQCGGVYYSPYLYGGRTVYLVVPPL